MNYYLYWIYLSKYSFSSSAKYSWLKKLRSRNNLSFEAWLWYRLIQLLAQFKLQDTGLLNHSTAHIDVLKAKFSWNNLIDTKLFINSFSPSFILMDYSELLKLHRLLWPTELGFTEDTKSVPFVFKWLNFFSLVLRRYSAFNNFQS